MVDTRKYNAQKNAYNKKHYKQVSLSLDKQKDSDIIEYLAGVQMPVNILFKELVRNEMKTPQEKRIETYWLKLKELEKAETDE